MNQHDPHDARLARALGDLAGARVPDYTPDVLARTRRSRQRPGWTFIERWFDMTTIAQRAPVARPLALIPRGFLLLIVLGLIIAMTVAGLAIGGRLELTRAVLPPAPVTGPAANGLIAFQRDGDIHVVEPDGSGERPLITAPGFQEAPSWSRDGTRIAYLSYATVGTPTDVMVANADGTGAIAVATGILEMFSGLDWSPDGASVVFAARTDPTRPTPCRPVGGADFCGSRVFTAAADGSTGAVAVGDPELDARWPVWSPDGTLIAFGGGDALTIRLYVMAPDGTGVRPVSTSTGYGWSFMKLDWSPDASQIVSQVGLGAGDIVLVPADGSGDTMVTETPIDELGASFAVDGSIGWWAHPLGNPDPCCTEVLGADGVRTALPGVGWPVFSPDGQYVLTNLSEEDAAALGTDVATNVVARDGTIAATILDADGFSWQRLAP
jgi:WD40 repeat protein